MCGMKAEWWGPRCSACSRGLREDDARDFIGRAVRHVPATHRLQCDSGRRQTDRGPSFVDGSRRAQWAQLDAVGAQQELGAVLLVLAGVDEGAVVQVCPVVDERVTDLDRTPEQDGGGALEDEIVVAVQGDAPGGSGSSRADEAVAGPLVFAQDAVQKLGVGLVGVPTTAELDAVELVAHACGPVRGRFRGAGDQLAGDVGPLRLFGCHVLLPSSAARWGAWVWQLISVLSRGRCSAASSRRATRSPSRPGPEPRTSPPMSVSRRSRAAMGSACRVWPARISARTSGRLCRAAKSEAHRVISRVMSSGCSGRVWTWPRRRQGPSPQLSPGSRAGTMQASSFPSSNRPTDVVCGSRNRAGTSAWAGTGRPLRVSQRCRSCARAAASARSASVRNLRTAYTAPGYFAANEVEAGASSLARGVGGLLTGSLRSAPPGRSAAASSRGQGSPGGW